MRKAISGWRERGQESGVLAVLLKDLNLEPSTHIRLFSADCNSRSRGFDILLGTLRALTNMLHIYIHTYRMEITADRRWQKKRVIKLKVE